MLTNNVSKAEFLRVANEVLKRMLALPGNKNPERTGEYITVLNKKTGKRYFVIEIGSCLPEMDANCFLYSIEKTDRLRENNLLHGHISAHESRNREQKKYAGAIVAPDDSLGLEEGRDLIGGGSGTNEHKEEVHLIVIWMIFRWLTLKDAKRFTAISDNPLLGQLLGACNDLFDRP